MATIKRPTPRTRPRVEDTEGYSSTAKKSATHKQVNGSAQIVGGEVLITAQVSELVPVAQYANVTLGPNQLQWKLGGVDLSVLADVDWDSENLTDEQQQVVDNVLGALRSTSRLLELHLAEDREAVENSIRIHNERDASEAKQSRRRS